MQRLVSGVFFLALTVLQPSAWCDEPAKSAPVRATTETTLQTAPGNIRQLAFDGRPDTFFASSNKLGAADHFTLMLEKPITLKSVAVITGTNSGGDQLEAGALQISTDGKTFTSLTEFRAGSARHESPSVQALAIRVQPSRDHDHPLAIREIQLSSEGDVVRFAYPVEFTIDVTEAPELKEWTEKVARICERAYPMINEELQSEGFVPAQSITLTMKRDYDGVAFASGNRITGSVRFFKDHPDDVGAMVHETAHVVQNYRSRNNPGWLVEGVADYVRYFKFEPEKPRRLDPARARYNGSYHTTASFLAFITNKYDRQAVLKLNQQMRQGTYTEAIFEKLTGKPLKELDEEWRSSLKP